LDEDWDAADIENPVEMEKVSTDSTNMRVVPSNALCGMEGWVDSTCNDFR
jgi:hypothetical protein